METIIGIENLKTQFRKAKLMCGDLRGLKNRFELAEKLGINPMQVYYFATGGNGDERMELTADLFGTSENQHDIHAYNMTDLVKYVLKATGEFEAHLVCLIWNKERTDAERKTVLSFRYRNS